MASRETYIYWLAQAARTLREEGGFLRVHVGAEAEHSDSVIWKFEQGRWPRYPERMISAYARVLGIDETQIWSLGLRLWVEHREVSSPKVTL